MNKIIFLLSSCFISLWSMEFFSYEKGLQLQKQNKKIIMLDAMRTDCHYCIDMERNVFDDPEMAKWIQKRFIPVKVNLDIDKLPLGLEVYFTPTFFFIDSNQKILKKVPGSWNIQDFKDLTKNINKGH